MSRPPTAGPGGPPVPAARPGRPPVPTAQPERPQPEPPTEGSVAAETPAVQLIAAGATIGGRRIWSDVDLTVRRGEFVAVLGPNGAGKSTLLKMILGLIPVSAGRVTVLGDRPGQRNRRIGYLPQRRAFDPATRVRGVDIVRLGLDGDRWGMPLPTWFPRSSGRAAQRRVDEVIDLVGATGYARRPIGQLSGGEQQRLLIAQALARRPDLLILDEPLDSLDVTNQAAVSSLIRDVSQSQHVAVLLVAHDVNPILSYLDQVIYLAHGGAVMGRPADVITADTLTMLYGTPIDVLTDRAGRLVVVGQPDTPAAHRHAGRDR
jgi:zinc/manganese transport system ATP-binding protein